MPNRPKRNVPHKIINSTDSQAKNDSPVPKKKSKGNDSIEIDYSKLAAEIIRQQTQSPSVQNNSVEIQDQDQDTNTHSDITILPESIVENTQPTTQVTQNSSNNNASTVSAGTNSTTFGPQIPAIINAQPQLNQPTSTVSTNPSINDAPAANHGQFASTSGIPNMDNSKNNSSALSVQQLVESLFTECKGGSTLVGAESNRNSTEYFDNLTEDAKFLLRSSLSDSAKTSYLRTWHAFFAFASHQTVSLPLAVPLIANYIGHLYSSGLKPATILSQVSALSYVHKLLNMPDSTASFIIRKILKGCQKLSPSRDTRLPITKHILQKLVSTLPSTAKSHYHQVLLKALYLFAFNGFFRLGELLVRPGISPSKVLQCQDISFHSLGKTISGLEIKLHHFKTNKDNKPVTIYLSSHNVQNKFCPVLAMQNYVQLYKHVDGPLFQHTNGKPVSTQFVSDHLSKAIEFIGLNPSQYKGHSFRIGAATHAASLGYAEPYIQKLGRWNSKAVHKYIRIQSFHL